MSIANNTCYCTGQIYALILVASGAHMSSHRCSVMAPGALGNVWPRRSMTGKLGPWLRPIETLAYGRVPCLLRASFVALFLVWYQV